MSSLLSAEAWTNLRDDVRAKRATLLLPCGYPSHAKTSKLGTPYFAHNPGGDGCSAGETAQHLLAKSLILQAAANVGWTAEPEVAGDGWVADVMATLAETRVVFEVQWSRQSLADYEQRQQRYRDAGLASTAWFARHTDQLPANRRDLPIFALTIDPEGEATVSIDGRQLNLTDTVERLLTRRLQHRTHLADGKSAVGRVDGARIDCYRCHKPFGVWSLERVIVQSRCGQVGKRRRPVTETFPTVRPETDGPMREAGAHLAKKIGVKPAALAMRNTKTSGTRYMAFVCPHCNATCGEMFVRNEFGVWDNHGLSTEVHLPATAIQQPHWCIEGPEGLCAVPPTSLVETLQRLEAAKHSTGSLTRVDPVHVPTGMGVHQVVTRMFGGYGR